MPLVTIHMYEGRTVEQQRELVAAVTDSVVRIARTSAEATGVVLIDVPRHNWSLAGKMACGQYSRPGPPS